MDIQNTPVSTQVEEMDKGYDTSRRRFFQLAGGFAGAGLLLAACRRTPPSTTFVGSGDTGLLNYLYILKQVTAAFYTQAVITPYYGITKSETTLQIDLRDQEITHREFLKNILGKSAVKEITVDLSPVTFADKRSLLSNAIILEDLSVGAYSGTAKLFSNTDNTLMVAKMASVDARHSAYVRDLFSYHSFAESSIVDGNGLDRVIAPLAGMTTLERYIQTKFDTSKLPTF